MDLIISHSCPSCGGPVEMDEADRLTVCPYCEVQNYMVGGRMHRYVLPDTIPDHIDRRSVVYFPYLRFKGNIYTCAGRDVDSKVLDTTHQGLPVRMLPPSLGLRPQAMKISMVHKGLAGKFIRRSETAAEVLHRAEKLARSAVGSVEDTLHHRAFIGESVSCLYLPLYIDNDRVHGGVLNRELGRLENWLVDSEHHMDLKRSWLPTYLAMICPQCGDAMRGEPDSLVVSCANCETCWTEDKHRFTKVPYELIEGEPGDSFLPFWRIAVTTKGIEMDSFADLLRITNQPVVVREKHRSRQLEFWIPALKIRPKVFITMAKGATLSQLNYPSGDVRLDKKIMRPTLPYKEALQAVKSVLGETA
ncbi:MAG: hypothetical protein HKN69_13175, partial [Desulfofustis sp.]|nr:hypothetical protein [Desulfofustis sp.]